MAADDDFDFFDSPRTRNNASEDKPIAKDRGGSPTTTADDTGSDRTLTSAKPPTHPKSRKVRHSGNSDEDPDSPRSNTSASTNQSRRTIEAKIPSVANDDSGSSDNDDESRSRSSGQSSHSSVKDGRRSEQSSRRSSSVGSSRGVKVKKERNRDVVDDRSSVSSEGDRKKRGSGGGQTKKKSKKSLYLSDDDSDGSDTDVTDTDSDVTQVSPLNSPHKPNALSGSNGKFSTARVKSAGKSKDVANYRSTLDQNTMNFNKILSSHKDSLDLKVLLQTVLEMESDSSSVKNHRTESRYVPPSGDFCRQRRNYSFTDDQVRKIDRENQRLMESIMRNARAAQKSKKEIRMASRKPGTVTQQRPASSTINRVRLQQKIEAENLGILRRLQMTRPSKELQRDTQIGEYKKHLVFAGCAPLSSIQPRPKPYFPRFANSSLSSDSQSTSDVSSQGAAKKHRPHSAFVTRPHSSKRSTSAPVKSRPKSAFVKSEAMKDFSPDDDYVDDFEVETFS